MYSFLDQDRAGNETECPTPFVLLAGKCIHLDLSVKGTYQEMREYCQTMGSDLAVLSSVNVFFESLQYMRITGESVLRRGEGVREEDV